MTVRTADTVYTCDAIMYVYDGSGYFLDLWLGGQGHQTGNPVRIPVSAVLAIEVLHGGA